MVLKDVHRLENQRISLINRTTWHPAIPNDVLNTLHAVITSHRHKGLLFVDPSMHFSKIPCPHCRNFIVSKHEIKG